MAIKGDISPVLHGETGVQLELVPSFDTCTGLLSVICPLRVICVFWYTYTTNHLIWCYGFELIIPFLDEVRQ